MSYCQPQSLIQDYFHPVDHAPPLIDLLDKHFPLHIAIVAIVLILIEEFSSLVNYIRVQ